MTKEIGTKKCLNCNTVNTLGQKYCPNCGQQIDENNLKIRAVFKEFFENYISLDSRIGRTVIPFLFKPGFLTNKFNQGQRKKYANPFRFYILISIFFFFVLTKLVINDEGKGFSSSVEDIELREFQEIPESERLKLNKGLSNLIVATINDSTYSDSSFYVVFNTLTDYQKKKVTKILNDSIQQALVIPPDSIYKDASSNVTFGMSQRGGFGISMDDFNLKDVDKYLNDPEYSDRQILDSLDLGDIDYKAEFVYLQVIRVSRSTIGSVNKFIIKNMSFAMFLVIPTTALFLFLFYFRNKKFYVEHLIHSFHLHSFVLFIYGLMLFVSSILDVESLDSMFIWMSFILSFIYIFKSFLVVYKQKMMRTIMKFIFISLFYWLNLLVIIILEAIISFLIF